MVKLKTPGVRTSTPVFSRYVFMGVQTIGEAHRAGWRIHVRCAWGRREAMKSAMLFACGRAGVTAPRKVEN